MIGHIRLNGQLRVRLLFPILIALLNPSSSVGFLIGFETLPLAGKVLAIFPEFDFED